MGHTPFCDYVDEDNTVIAEKQNALSHQDIQEIKKRFETLYFNWESAQSSVRKIKPYRDTNTIPIPQNEYNGLDDEPEESEAERLEHIIAPESQFSKMMLENEHLTNKLDEEPVTTNLTFDNSFSNFIKQVGFGERTEEYLQKMEFFHEELIATTKNIYSNIISGDISRADPISDTINRLIDIMRTDKDILLNICNYDYPGDEDHLFHQTTNTTINTLNIAAAMGFDYDAILEIGQGAFLADIGMAAINDKMRNVDKKYTQNEIFEIQKHPIFAANIIDSIQGLKPSAAIIAYQHHERENGQGYPRGRSKNAIHPYAKIFAIADVYSALSSNRKHRKAQRPFYAMKSLISMGKVGLLDLKTIAHFIQYSSLFPIGSLVKLNNGAIAKVLSSNHDDVTAPIVSVMSNFKGELIKDRHYYELDLHKRNDIKIVGTLDSFEFENDLMMGF